MILARDSMNTTSGLPDTLPNIKPVEWVIVPLTGALSA